jgi:L,D-peptidoglycan transpeptidase YkuD (ErfK/YbiS/YcfS/YnhG family)
MKKLLFFIFTAIVLIYATGVLDNRVFAVDRHSNISFSFSDEIKVHKSSDLGEYPDLLEKVHELNGSKQVIIVAVKKESDFKAILYTYELTEDGWKKPFQQMSAVIGEKGMSANKKEGDMKAPAGIFKIGKAFGIPEEYYLDTKLSYTCTTYNDYWIDDPESVDYNKWINYAGDPDKRWKSFERLRIPLYKYTVVIEYNTETIIKGKGSAIFLHLWRNADASTSGCTALSEKDMLKVLGWLDPSKNPVIIQGSEDMLANMASSIEESVLYPVKVKFNDSEIVLDVCPRLINGRVLVPVRTIFDNMNMDISWDEVKRTVTIKKEDTEIVLLIGDKTALVNGQSISLDVAPEIINGRTLIPVRFITESTGYKIDWDESTRTVLIKDSTFPLIVF